MSNCCFPANTAAFILATANTPSVKLSGNGSVGTPLKADMKISATAGNGITVLPDGVYCSSSGGGVTSLVNLGSTGSTVLASFSSGVGSFRRLNEGTGIVLTQNTNDIIIATTAEANTASNLGATGASVFSSKVGVDLRFRKLVQGFNMLVTEGTNDITIASDGSQTVVLNTNGSVSVSAGYIITHIIIQPANNLTNFMIGTTPGGGEIESGVDIPTGASAVYTPSQFFPTSGNLYFTNVNTGTSITIKKL